MKLSLNWLESYFVQKPDWDAVWAKLTMAGIEVEGIEAVAPHFSGIVVAEVIECSKHPDADKLNVCQVDDGSGQILQIICGAANVTTGVKVPCARVGAVLPDGLKIAERKMRGMTSFGMLCSGVEIACPDGVDGLLLLPHDAPKGINIRDYLGLDDQVVEFKITPNRGDCLSVQGLLREIAALTGYAINQVVVKELTPHLEEQITVIMQASEQCPNYICLPIKGVNNKGALPEYMQKRLSRSGIRSISPIVDIANYVMLELGQPLHAFDMAKTGTTLQVRLAQSGDTLKLLDGTVANLANNTLLICDAVNQPAAIAGVMGGFDSGISIDTTDIILESAFFTPLTIAGKAKQYGVSSDAAYRYERGVDPQLQYRAICYVAELITQYCGGKLGLINQVADTNISQATPITLRYSELNKLIGTVIEPQNINAMLSSLGFMVSNTADSLTVNKPSYRFDIAIKEDIVEEVARVYGYDNIVAVMPTAQLSLDKVEDSQSKLHILKQIMVNLGYNEIVGYAFLEDKYEELMGNPEVTAIELLNPIAGLNVMRTSLLADLVKVLIRNKNRGHKDIKLFQLSRVFHGEDASAQPLKLAGLLSGNAIVHGLAKDSAIADFFDLKYTVELLLAGYGELSFSRCSDNPVFHSGRCATISLNGTMIGIIGQLHPRLGQELDLHDIPYVFELDLAFTEKELLKPAIASTSKFQKVSRDLAFLLNSDIEAGSLIKAIKDSQPGNLIDMYIFDVYQGENMAAGLKSVAVNFIFQAADHTLSDDEVTTSIESITNLVQTKFGATLRK